jgi:xylan 1,4-beta-xylosidase
VIAEGGTGPDHAVTVARSRAIAGPYLGKPSNPILTHRHLGSGRPIVNVGHADLVDDPAGDWWMLLLASRPLRGRSSMGRETFLAPLAWEDGWPLPSPGSGLLLEEFPLPRLPRFDAPAQPGRDDFEGPELDPRYLSLRGPAAAVSSLAERPGFLRLRLPAATLRDKSAAAFVGRRQTHASWAASAALDFEPDRPGEAAGLALVQSEDFQYRLELVFADGVPKIRLALAAGEGLPDTVLAEQPLDPAAKSGAPHSLVLAAESRDLELRFLYGPSRESLAVLAEGLDGGVLSTEIAGGFVGTVIGVFATGGGSASQKTADIDWFEYHGI